MREWLIRFPFRIELSPFIFLFSGFVVLITAIIAIGYRTVTAVKTNPVEALKYE
jgi:putative ABC transport system permease protein